jgi:hypothetical protein
MMNYLNKNQFDLGAESQDDARIAIEVLSRKASQTQQQIDALLLDRSGNEQQQLWAKLSLQLADIQIEMDNGKSAWENAFPAFRVFIDQKNWEQAVVVCDTLFRSDQADSLVALGHGLWLSITFPVNPTLTLSQLQHVIDDTPENSDGGAVAAAMAAYVVDLRNGESHRDDATLAVGQMLHEVARRHGNATSQQEFDRWFQRLELDQPKKLLIRMRNIIDVLVQDQWWVDRSALQRLIVD